MTQRTCTVEGCERIPHGRGLCGKHYQRWRDHGDANRVKPSTAERFWTKVDKSGGPDACWRWLGWVGHLGYGTFYTPAGTIGAHRFALAVQLGRPLSSGEVARHKCHNPSCVNPAHLAQGTPADNSRDMVEAGRATQRGARGEDNGKHILTEEQVRYIRSTTVEPRRALAERFGVSVSAIKAVRARQNWRHVQ